MRILLYGNAPTAPTGYGVQIALLARRLKADGHEVAVAATYGQQATGRMWEGVHVYHCGYNTQSNDKIHHDALNWFQGDPKGGWIIVLNDLWAIVNPLLDEFNVVGWCPVDHYPIPADVVQFFHRTGAVAVAMSRFGDQLMCQVGLDPTYIPLAVDTKAYQPTADVVYAGQTMTGRQLMDVPDDAFVVGMVGMNKDPGDRKGFNEAFRAFAAFWKDHPNAVLYVHGDKNGMGTGFNLETLSIHSAVPPHAIKFVDGYRYQNGFTPEQMAAIYTGMDVLLAPSRGEGFCVPLIEAQACGTPVIVNDFSAQPELVGAGWTVKGGHPLWDPAQSASYVAANIQGVVAALQEAYTNPVDPATAIQFAQQYDADRVYDEHWRPFLDLLDADAEPLPLNRDEPFDVDVIVPLMRPDNLPRLTESFNATNDGTARLVFVCDNPTVGDAMSLLPRCDVSQTGKARTSYAEKVNQGYGVTVAPWVLLVGDDVEFHPGWIQEASKLADRYDVIGTNDSLPDRTRNPDVADGSHSDHFFVRRSYADTYGASLDGPGILAPEAYGHWFVDKEIVELAKARDVFAPCLSSIVEHHHPGYDGKERDLVYVSAINSSEEDAKTYRDRLPLILQQRRSLKR